MERLTYVMFSKSFTYAISPLINSKITLFEVQNKQTSSIITGLRAYDCLLASCLDSFCLTSGGTSSCHSHFPGTPLPIAAWNVRSCATLCKFLMASIASDKNSESGFSSAVSFLTASRRTGYCSKCSEGRFKKFLRSKRDESPVWEDCCLEHCCVPMSAVADRDSAQSRTSKNCLSPLFDSNSSFNLFSDTGRCPMYVG